MQLRVIKTSSPWITFHFVLLNDTWTLWDIIKDRQRFFHKKTKVSIIKEKET
jgi:hypothetical protein